MNIYKYIYTLKHTYLVPMFYFVSQCIHVYIYIFIKHLRFMYIEIHVYILYLHNVYIKCVSNFLKLYLDV